MASRGICSNVMLERWLLQSCLGILTVARLDVCSVPADASASASETDVLLAGCAALPWVFSEGSEACRDQSFQGGTNRRFVKQRQNFDAPGI